MSKNEVSPSKCEKKGKKWILYGLKDSKSRLEDYIKENDVSDPNSKDKIELEDYDNQKVKDIDRRALTDGYLSGKWEMEIDPKRVDEVWDLIKKLIDKNQIWGAQVTTRWIREERDLEYHMIRVYTPNYLDEKDVLRVGDLLKDKCGIEKRIIYKPDIYNILQVYSDKGDQMKLPKEIRHDLSTTPP